MCVCVSSCHCWLFAAVPSVTMGGIVCCAASGNPERGSATDDGAADSAAVSNPTATMDFISLF